MLELVATEQVTWPVTWRSLTCHSTLILVEFRAITFCRIGASKTGGDRATHYPVEHRQTLPGTLGPCHCELKLWGCEVVGLWHCCRTRTIHNHLRKYWIMHLECQVDDLETHTHTGLVQYSIVLALIIPRPVQTGWGRRLSWIALTIPRLHTDTP